LPNSCTACSSLYYHLVETTSCFTSCPPFYYNYQLNWTCQACSQKCKTCVNSTYCSVCDTSYFLYQQKCIAACPAGTFSNTALGVCLDCPRGCFNCSGNSLCFACFEGYYFNSTLGFCFSCNSVCLNCTGPGQKDCTACTSPLFLQKGTCSVLSCSMGTYIDPLKGCLPCSDLFPGSLLCNISQPFSCSSNYIFSSNSCLFCDKVPGYRFSRGKCE
jgi:proprotein convertase subtilisin/kexin type 5